MKYIFIQNMIAPYRTSLFNKLETLGLGFEVLYMCELENDRLSWKIDHSQMHYRYQVLKGFYKTIHGFQFHWDPKIIRFIRKNPDSKVILGGSWNCPDIIAICLLKRTRLIKNELIFWAEANYLTLGARKKNRFRDSLRSFVYHSGDGRFIVPGRMSVETYKRWGIGVKEFIFLPNVIEEEKFRDFVHLPNKSILPVFIIPARLEEHIKGQLNFFKSIGVKNLKRARFYLLGDGRSEGAIKEFIRDNQLENNIILMGNQTMEGMVSHYRIADVCVLPSFTDASPLALVESICCGLPLLISNYCGNHFETLVEGENGFSFSPYIPNEVKECFEKMMELRPLWPTMGRRSEELFKQNFKQEIVLKRFINQLQNK